MKSDDRRAHDRMPLVRGCKLLDQKSAKFVPAETTNISQGGLLLRVPATRHFQSGDRVEVAVGWGEKPVAESVAMSGGVVVRVTTMDHLHQAIAVRYDVAEAVGEPDLEAGEQVDDAVEADDATEGLRIAA
jgi:hypothetical protein